MNKRRFMLLASGLIVVAALAATGKFPQHGDHYGFWSVLPPAVAIILAFATRDVITSLFLGIALGGVISGRLNIVQDYLIPSIGSEAYAERIRCLPLPGPGFGRQLTLYARTDELGALPARIAAAAADVLGRTCLPAIAAHAPWMAEDMTVARVHEEGR